MISIMVPTKSGWICLVLSTSQSTWHRPRLIKLNGQAGLPTGQTTGQLIFTSLNQLAIHTMVSFPSRHRTYAPILAGQQSV